MGVCVRDVVHEDCQLELSHSLDCRLCTTIQTFMVYIQYAPKIVSNYGAVVRSDRSEFSMA